MWNLTVFRKIFLTKFVCESWYQQGKIFWRASSIWKVKKSNPTKIKCKKYLQNFWISLSWTFELVFKLFSLTAILLQFAGWFCIRIWHYSPLISSLVDTSVFQMLQNQASLCMIPATVWNQTSLKKLCVTMYTNNQKQPSEVSKKCY